MSKENDFWNGLQFGQIVCRLREQSARIQWVVLSSMHLVEVILDAGVDPGEPLWRPTMQLHRDLVRLGEVMQEAIRAQQRPPA